MRPYSTDQIKGASTVGSYWTDPIQGKAVQIQSWGLSRRLESLVPITGGVQWGYLKRSNHVVCFAPWLSTLVFCCIILTEMHVGIEQNVASRALFLRPMWNSIRRRRVSWKGRKSILQVRLTLQIVHWCGGRFVLVAICLATFDFHTWTIYASLVTQVANELTDRPPDSPTDRPATL